MVALMAGYFVPPTLARSLPAAALPSRCTVQARRDSDADGVSDLDEYGQPLGGGADGDAGNPDWLTLAGLVDIPCRLTHDQRAGGERERTTSTSTQQMHRLVLDGYYPTLTTAMRALVDGTAYDIDEVIHDGAQTLTRLRVERTT